MYKKFYRPDLIDFSLELYKACELVSCSESLENKKINLVYYTDPTCCSCWAFEPILRRFTLEYGRYFNLIIKIGGLFESCHFTKNENIKLSDSNEIKNYWKTIGEFYQTSISGKIWNEDVIYTSIPPSRAFFAARKQSNSLALKYLRKLRESLFIYDINITKEVNLFNLAKDSGLFIEKFIFDYNDKMSESLLTHDLLDSKTLNIDVLPTLLYIGEDDSIKKISGIRNYEEYISLLKEALGFAPIPNSLNYSLLELFEQYDIISSNELADLSSSSSKVIDGDLKELLRLNLIEPIHIDSTIYWKKK